MIKFVETVFNCVQLNKLFMVVALSTVFNQTSYI